MSGNCDDPTKRSGKAGARTNPAKNKPVTSTSIHGRNTAGNHGGYSSSNSEQSTVGQNIPRGSDNSSDFDVWVVPNCSDVKPDQGAIPKVKPADVKPDQGAIPKVKPAGGVFQKVWKDFHVLIERKEDMKILEQCGCKESLPPVKMQYLVNLHFKELETALCDELLKLKWNVKCVKSGDQCLSIEVRNYTDDCVVEEVILLLGDEVNKVNYCQSMPASKHPELLLKEYIDSGNLAIYVDDEKVFVVGIVENPRKVIEMLRKKPTSTDYSSTAAYKTDVLLVNPVKCQLLTYLQFLPSLKQKHPSVNVVMDEERSIISICGSNLVDVHAAVEDVDIFIKKFAVEDIELDPLLIQLLKLPDIKTFIKKLCEEQDLKVIWTLSELNNRITCHCKDRKAVQDLKDVLNHNLEKKTYRYSKQSFGDKTINFSATSMFSDFVEKHYGKRLVSTVQGNSMHIFTTRDIGNELTLLEVTFKDTKIDVQKNLTQDEKKDIHAYSRDIQFNKPFYCQLLEYHQFLPNLKQKHPSVNVAMDEERSIMSFCGDNRDDVQAAVNDVHVFTKDFAVEDITLDPLLIQLLKLPDIKMFIKKLCEEEDLKVIWTLTESNHSITCYCKDRKAVQYFSDVLKHNLEKKTYPVQSFGDKTITFSTTSMFSDFVEKHYDKRLVSIVEGNRMHIFTTRDIGNELTLLEVTFKGTKIDVQKNFTQDEKKDIHAYSRDIQFNKPFYCQLLEYHQFLPNLKQKHPSVIVAMDEERSIMSFCGDNRDDVQAAVNDVQVFVKDFAIENITLDPLLIQLLKLPDIKMFIKKLCEEEDLKVIWTLTESNHSITCYCKHRKAVQYFSDVLKHNLEKKTYPVQSFGDKTITFSTTSMFSDFVEKHYDKRLVSIVEGNRMHIFTTRDIGNELTLLEVTFKGTKIDIPKNLTQDEKKDIHGQTSATRKENTTEEETSVVKIPMPHQELQMLKKFDFKTHLSRQIPDMQVTITDDGIVLVSGTKKRLNDEIKSFMSKFSFKRIESLPPSVLKFYDNCDIVKRTVAARLEKKGIVCHWYVDLNEQFLNLFTPDRKSLSTAESEIFNTVKYTEYSNTDYAKDVLKCSEVKSVLEKRKNELRLFDIDGEEFLVVGLSDAVEEFSKNFERISERQEPTLFVTKQRFGVSKDFVNCYSKLKSDACKTLCDLYRVKVEIDQNDEVVVVGSEKQNVQNAVSLLQKEIGKLTKEKWSCEVFDPRDVQAKLQSDIIPSLENRFQCSVSIESNTSLVYQQQLGQWVNWDKGLHLILVHGHMSEMAADVLVCPVNKSLNPSRLGSSMMEKGGSIMKQDLKQKAIVEGQDIYLSSETGNLPCLMMAYLAVPEYKHGVNMQSQVIKCIHELLCSVEKAQFQSLVIPVKLWNDIPEATFLHWFVRALHTNLSLLNSLKQIYLCFEDMHKSRVTLKALSDELSKNDWHEYDFEHLIENLQTSLPGKRSSRPAEIYISLVKGKLVDQQVDVIVNSSNIKLELDRGAVSKSIFDKGGRSILDECRARFPRGIDYGEVVCTKPGKMNFKFICHSALPHWTPSAKYSIKILEKLVFDCLVYAQTAQCRSIAFPVFGTGNLLYPWDEVAKAMIDTINKYGRMNYDTTIREVKIVLFDKDIKSIQAFETKKKQTEEVKLIPEDPEAPPTFILESRCRNVRVQVIPLSDTTCHHCQAVVKFVTSGQAVKLQKDNPQSNLSTDGIVKIKNENSTFWTVTVISDDNEKSYKEAVLKILVFATEERIATLAFCLMHSTGLKFKVQATIVRDYIYNALEKNRYLQIVKIIVPSRDEFDLMLKDDQFEEHKGFLSVFSSNRPPWKRVRYSDFVEKPRLLISVLGEKRRQIDELKENLQSTIQKLVNKV